MVNERESTLQYTREFTRVLLRTYHGTTHSYQVMRLLFLGRRSAGLLLLRRELSGLATTRNVGIIAHIDAGKTTTTERMLLLAGMTRSAGGVDTGDTVMDFMEQERERGITIQAAATRFDWTAAAAATRFGICLIDTPGHVDFTIEVERTTRVLDGAVLIVDAVAGAQAQTETVWRQARSHGVPAVAFINKMDREGARFDVALASLHQRLNITPLAVQLPLSTAEGIVGGAVDLIEMEALVYRPSEAKQGGRAQGGRAQRGAALTLVRQPLTIDGCNGSVAAALVPAATLPAEMLEAAVGARRALVEAVAELEPEGDVAAMYLEESTVTSAQLRAAVCIGAFVIAY